jgi:urea carboxylase
MPPAPIEVLDPRRADHGAGLAGAARLLGRGRAALGPMDDWRCAWPTGCSAMRPRAPPGWRCTLSGPDACAFTRHRDRADRRADAEPRSTAKPCRTVARSHVAAGSVLKLGGGAGRRLRAPTWRCGRSRCAAVPGQPLHLHAGPVRRPRGAHAAHRRRAASRRRRAGCGEAGSRKLAGAVPVYGTHWDIAVLYGPHGAPDFFTDDDIAMFFGTRLAVHYNSSRTGVRLIGPKPQWARTRRRRGRAASVQHPRQRLCDRRDRFHRRHAGDPRARWSQPGRLRLPGHRGAGLRVAGSSASCAPATRCGSLRHGRPRPACRRRMRNAG